MFSEIATMISQQQINNYFFCPPFSLLFFLKAVMKSIFWEIKIVIIAAKN
jgi:hypothetical protein